MKLKNGVYRIYEVIQNHGTPEEVLVARFWIDKGDFFILEDHFHLFEDQLPSGKLDKVHQSLFEKIFNSGYFRVVKEDEVEKGDHDHLIQDLDLGPTESDLELMLVSDSEPPKRLEMFEGSAIVDGQKLSDEEFIELINKIQLGQIKPVVI